MGFELRTNQLRPIGQNNNAPEVNFERSAQNITEDLRKQIQEVGNYATERIDDCISGWQHELAAQKSKCSWLRNPLKADSEEKDNSYNLKQQADKEIKELQRLKNAIKNRETRLKKKENNILKIHKLSGKILFEARQVTKREGVFEVAPKSFRDLDCKLGELLDDKDDFFVAYSIFPDSWDFDQNSNLKPSLETSLAKASSSMEALSLIYEARIESTKGKMQLFNEALSEDIQKLERKYDLSQFSESKIMIRINLCGVAENKKKLLQLLKFCKRVASIRKKIQSLHERIQELEREMYMVKNTNSASLKGFAPLKVCAEVEAQLEKISAKYSQAKTKIEL